MRNVISITDGKAKLRCGEKTFALSVHPERDGRPVTGKAVVNGEGTVFIFDGGIVSVLTAEEDRRDGHIGALTVEAIFSGQGAWSVLITLETQAPEKSRLFVPAVSYRENSTGTGVFPKGGLEAGWEFMEERMPICGCVSYYVDGDVSYVYLDPANDDFGASVGAEWSDREKNLALVSVRLPGTENPVSYQGKKAVRKLPTNTVRVAEKPFSIRRTIHLVSYATDLLESYEKLVDSQNSATAIPETDLVPSEVFFRLKMRHLEYLIETANDGTGEYLIMGRNNGNHQPIYEFTGASFLVKSLEGALIFAREAAAEQNPDIKNEYIRHALEIGRYFLQAERKPGIFRENHNIATGEWGGYLGIGEHPEYAQCVNARCCGEAMFSYIKLYEALLKLGVERQEFIDIAVRVTDFFLKHQLANGSFGRWWSEDGDPVNAEGTNGAYIIPVLLALMPYMKGQDRYKTAIERAGTWYRTVIDRGDFYGDTLDADTCDKESAVILLRMSLDLFDSTGNAIWLDAAKKAARFTLTWIWQYDIVFPVDSPLASENFHTRGMTSVSVAHHHMDFYGLYIAVDFLRLWRHTGEEIYHRQASLLSNACRQLVARPEHELGKDPQMTGWQPEQINYTLWDYFDRPECMKGHFDICIAWVSVLQLGAMQEIRERKLS
jgi:hypothetical protein